MSKQVISTINMSTCKPVNLSTKTKKIMATFLDKLKKRLQTWHEERADRMQNKRQARLDAEAREAVQVMEFNGELYVSVHGIPLFGQSDLSDDLTEAVASGRKAYKDWKEEKLWEQSGTTHGFIPC
uniref:Uncharacterized protein n=1 Tax=Siphoviridae sp. ctDIL13 TaxID=2827811 RepID=A0A8S5SY17_9CAUD|nr:MAG TPA: hypothetical protein [Siphoviridae sp. ctDIL13]